MSKHPRAGMPVESGDLVDIEALRCAYHSVQPDPGVEAQCVAFGTSGHRGSSLTATFNEAHILAITQAVCEYRMGEGIRGPLYIGMDTHALSALALDTALEVLAANAVEVRAAPRGAFTPTPAISLAIITHNKGRSAGSSSADGIVITPSHNPPQDGGFKYNPPHGGPAGSSTTAGIQQRANELLLAGLAGVKRTAAAATTEFDFMGHYVRALTSVVDLARVRDAGVRIGVDPLGGSGIAYWGAIADHYGLDLEVVNDVVDPQFGFMTLDHDGKIRMDCSSVDAMAGLIARKDRFDVCCASDPDHDRHGIVTPAGLMPPNHYLAVAIDYLFRERTGWRPDARIGKTCVSSSVIDWVGAKRVKREVTEVPVGFKWFVEGLETGTFGFGGEESAGASFLRMDGSTWTTDKDGLIMGLLAAEILAVTGANPAAHYQDLTRQLGETAYERTDTTVTEEQKEAFKHLTRESVTATELAGSPVLDTFTVAPGNNEPIGGIKVVTQDAWFAARPSGTEDVYKFYAESFIGAEHLRRVQEDGRVIMAEALG